MPSSAPGSRCSVSYHDLQELLYSRLALRELRCSLNSGVLNGHVEPAGAILVLLEPARELSFWRMVMSARSNC